MPTDGLAASSSRTPTALTSKTRPRLASETPHHAYASLNSLYGCRVCAACACASCCCLAERFSTGLYHCQQFSVNSMLTAAMVYRATTTTVTGQCGSSPCSAALTPTRCWQRLMLASGPSATLTSALWLSTTLHSARPSASLCTAQLAPRITAFPSSAQSLSA